MAKRMVRRPSRADIDRALELWRMQHEPDPENETAPAGTRAADRESREHRQSTPTKRKASA